MYKLISAVVAGLFCVSLSFGAFAAEDMKKDSSKDSKKEMTMKDCEKLTTAADKDKCMTDVKAKDKGMHKDGMSKDSMSKDKMTK